MIIKNVKWISAQSNQVYFLEVQLMCVRFCGLWAVIHENKKTTMQCVDCGTIFMYTVYIFYAFVMSTSANPLLIFYRHWSLCILFPSCFSSSSRLFMDSVRLFMCVLQTLLCCSEAVNRLTIWIHIAMFAT